jgi:hypothetical protein
VDARLHHLQGKAKLVKAIDMLELLKEFYREKSAMRHAHASTAQHVSHYDFNNTYQYVIASEDMHLRWLIDAITDLGGQPDEGSAPARHVSGKGDAAARSAIEADRKSADEFLARWRGRVDSLPNARNRTLLTLILGETMEHRRFFEQALAGRSDLLGRRADGAGTGGGVLATRWVGSEKT